MEQARLQRVVAAGANALGQAFKWWLGELGDLLPRQWRERERPRIEARLDESGTALRICGTSRAAQGRLDASGLVPQVLAKAIAQQRGILPVWVYPPPGIVLSRSVSLPRSVLGQFQRLLATEVERWTSFPLDELYLAWRTQNSDKSSKAEITLYFIPRATIERALEALRAQGLEPSRVVLEASERIAAPLGMTHTAGQQRVRRIAATVTIAAITAFLIVDWFASIHERDALREKIAVERREFNRQRDIEGKIASILATSSDDAGDTAKSRNDFLAAVSEALPATDWLTDIVIRASQVTLRGYTLQPEALMKALEPLSKDRTVSLQGELAVDKRFNRNRFSVVLQLPR